MEYRVTWVIDVDADDPTDAAWQAREAVTRPGSIATVYHVQQVGPGFTPIGESVEVDLGEQE